MAIKFRIANTARENMESLRNVMRRRAACLMAAIVLAAGVLLWVLKVFVAPPPDAQFDVYIPPSDESPQQEVKQYEDLSVKSSPRTPVPTVIVSTSVAIDNQFSMDLDMPDLSVEDSGGPSGMGGDGLGNGLGGGNGGGMGGEKVESAFLGVLYDLKKRSDGKPSGYAQALFNNEVLVQESKFINKAWDQMAFTPFFRAKQKLYTTCFFMPNSLDEEACNAYDSSGKLGLKPGRWVAIYRAKVQAPATGTYRFVGVADSVMAVRFNGKNVLTCGLHNLNTASWNEWQLEPIYKDSGDSDELDEDKMRAKVADAVKKRGLFAYKGCEYWNMQQGGFAAGEEFSVKRGEWYEMQVLISEIGGGNFGFCLLIDDVSSSSKKRTADGMPLFQLFRTAFVAPNAEEVYKTIKYKDTDKAGNVYGFTDPPYDPDGEVWVARPVEPDVRMK